MRRHPSPVIRQHNTHGDLVGEDHRAGRGSEVSLDAIIVPASRPATNLDHAVTLARAARCRLLLLCSREAHVAEVNNLLALRSFHDAIVVHLPDNYTHSWLGAATSMAAAVDLPTECVPRKTDLSIKRNLGLILARMLGWKSIFFMDDDIRDFGYPDLRSTVSMLGQYHSVGMRVTEFPDNSVVCHAHRETGGFQDVLVGGSALAVDTTAPIGFFPDIYNEDWLFFYHDVANRRLGCSGRKATQLVYDPFADPQRAAGQEFGDVLAEGLYALLHLGVRAESATADYWTEFLSARKGFLDAIVDRSHSAPAQRRDNMLAAVEAAKDSLQQIKPKQCEYFVTLWRNGLVEWEQELKQISPGLSVREALRKLNLNPAEESTAWDPWLGRNHELVNILPGPVSVPPGPVSIPRFASLSGLLQAGPAPAVPVLADLSTSGLVLPANAGLGQALAPRPTFSARRPASAGRVFGMLISCLQVALGALVVGSRSRPVRNGRASAHFPDEPEVLAGRAAAELRGDTDAGLGTHRAEAWTVAQPSRAEAGTSPAGFWLG